jgi:NAD(P)-dependent dehydrogenase (short-subunit alcohol dehydrogenase family)
MLFKGKSALVTGSSRGIGRGIALKLAEKGARIAIHYRNKDAAQATLESVRKLGTDGFLVQADVCQPDEVKRIFQQVRSEFGSLDIFVSNARTEAPTFYEATMEITLEKWDTAMDSQAKAFLVGVREAVPLMSDGGRIIAITFAPGAGLEAGSLGLPWVRRKQQWRFWCDISQLRSLIEVSPSILLVPAGLKTVCSIACRKSFKLVCASGRNAVGLPCDGWVDPWISAMPWH